MTTLKFFSGNFYYVSNLESTFLERIRFASEILFKKSNSVWKIAPKKNFVNWHCKNLKVAIFVLSWKTCLWKSYFFKKNRFLIKTSEENQILNHFFSKRVRLWANFQRLDNYQIENFTDFEKKILTIHQILKWNCFVKKQISMKVLLSENHFWIFLGRESANFCSYAPSQKPRIGGVIEKKHVSNQNFSKGSYFEATFSELFTLWVKILKTCSNLTQF